MSLPDHVDLAELWDTASGDGAWRERVRGLAVSQRRLLLAIADARYVDARVEARRSRTVYAALSRETDPGSPAEVVRIHRLFEGPFDGGWPMELMRRAFRRSVDRETELRCGTLCAQQLVLEGATTEGIELLAALLSRTWGSGVEAEGAALLILGAALASEGRYPEALAAASASTTWTASRTLRGWPVIARTARAQVLLALRAVDEAACAVDALVASTVTAPVDRRPLARATARVLEAGVWLFKGDAERALAGLRPALDDVRAAAPVTDGLEPYVDLEVEALRRLGRVGEARRRLEGARASTPTLPATPHGTSPVTAPATPHAAALRAALAAADGDLGPARALVVELASGSRASTAPGLRVAGLAYVLDAAADGSATVELAAAAGDVLGAALAGRVDELAAFRDAFPGLADGTPQDRAVVARRVAPDGPRTSGPWPVALEAMAASPAFRGAFRLDRERPVVCGPCGAVDTVRHGWLPVRALLPHADAACATVAACPRCAGG